MIDRVRNIIAGYLDGIDYGYEYIEKTNEKAYNIGYNLGKNIINKLNKNYIECEKEIDGKIKNIHKKEEYIKFDIGVLNMELLDINNISRINEICDELDNKRKLLEELNKETEYINKDVREKYNKPVQYYCEDALEDEHFKELLVEMLMREPSEVELTLFSEAFKLGYDVGCRYN